MITLVTVNFNNAQATQHLLESLESQSSRDFELIIVDNSSNEQDRELLGKITTSTDLNLRIHWSEVNNGFAAGSNIGIRLAFQQGADWAVLINNDAVAGQNGITALQQLLAKTQPAIVALPLYEHGKTVRAGLVRWLSATLPHLFEIPTRQTRYYAIGGGMAIHRTVFEHIGPMDERYFLYFEDAEYSERARRAGIPIVVADIPALSHEVSATTTKLGSPLLLRYHFRNALRFNWRHAPWWAKIALPFWSFWSMIKQLVKIMIIPSRRAQSRAILAGIIDFYAGKSGQIPAPNHPNRH